MDGKACTGVESMLLLFSRDLMFDMFALRATLAIINGHGLNLNMGCLLFGEQTKQELLASCKRLIFFS